MLLFWCRGSLLTSLFIFLCGVMHLKAEAQSASFDDQKTRAQIHTVSQHPVWLALLHHQDPQPVIASTEFLLSFPHYSPELELQLSLKALTGAKHQEFRCRFPARYMWIVQQFKLSLAVSAPCEELQTFLTKVPTDQIQLIYAAENINQPSSMMGHTFLNFVGRADDGQVRQHAISFFTELDTVNVPQVVFSSLVTGRDAVFMVSPYPEKRRFYQEVEQRNVIEYGLNLTAEQRQLMQLHVWELGQLRMPYFFHRFNCATLTQQLLTIADRRLEPIGWVSPLDVIKNTQHVGLVNSLKLEPSTRWYLRTLQRGLSNPEQVKALKNSLDTDVQLPVATSNNERFYLQQLAMNYLKYQYDQGILTTTALAEKSALVQQTYPTPADLQLTLSRDNDPMQRPDDSQWSFGYVNRSFDAAWQLDWQPASHQLTDDNRQLSSESALQLMSLQVRYVPKTADWQLQQFMLYRIQNFIPDDTLAGGLSVQFSLGMERQSSEIIKQKLTPYVSGGMGKTYQLSDDMQVYGLWNAGLARGNGDLHVYSGPEVGLFVYEIGHMKSTLSYSAWFNMQGSSQWSEHLSWRQSWFFHPDFSLQFHFAKNRFNQISEYESMLQLRSYY